MSDLMLWFDGWYKGRSKLIHILGAVLLGWTSCSVMRDTLTTNLQDVFTVLHSVSNYEQVNVTDANVSLPIVSSSPVWSSLPSHRKGFGVVYCAYSKDTKKSLPQFFQEALKSAQQLKDKNPTITIAMITNARRQDVPTVFDHIIEVEDSMLFQGESKRPDGVFRQWFSRMYYLAHSPFEFTWYVDSHTVFLTTELEQAFQEFKASHIDFAVSSANPTSTYIVCHNFALLFRWNERVKNLFVDWILEQLKGGISADDQGTLCRALRHGKNKYGIQYAALSPQWAFSWLSLKSSNSSLWSYRTTRVISSKTHICHSPDLCAVTASESHSGPRIYYKNSSNVVIPIYNQVQASSLLPYPYPSYDWKAQAKICQGVFCIPSS